MSIGVGGWAELDCQDEQMAIYRYGTYNLNEPEHRNKEHIKDGIIFIDKSSLVEPEYRERWKKVSKKKKILITEKFLSPVPYEEYFAESRIEVIPTKNSWQVMYYNDELNAWKLIDKIYIYYQENGEIPDYVSFHV